MYCYGGIETWSESRDTNSSKQGTCLVCGVGVANGVCFAGKVAQCTERVKNKVSRANNRHYISRC